MDEIKKPIKENNKLLLVVGPTASGKTKLAIKLAENYNSELVNADSRQVYKHMNIGTNKGSLTQLSDKLYINGKFKNIYAYQLEKSSVVGWLFDVVKPNEEFNVSDYKLLANLVINNIKKKNKNVILVGGTGLYIDVLIHNFDLGNVPPDIRLRSKLEKLSVVELQNQLSTLNKVLYSDLNNSDKNNPRRLIRKLEIILNSHKKTKENTQRFNNYQFIYLQPPLPILFSKINERVDKMIEDGFISEVENLIAKGYRNTKPMNGLGYKQVVSYLDKKVSLIECIEKIKQEHRNYAKRQITWFNARRKKNWIVLKSV